MENGERKKLSSTLSDGDHKEENSLYLSCSAFSAALLKGAGVGGGLGIAEEAQIQLPSGLLCWFCETVLVVQGKAFYPSRVLNLPFRHGSYPLTNT